MKIPSILLVTVISMLVTAFGILAYCQFSFTAGDKQVGIGICYGLNSDHLPPPDQIVQLYHKCGVKTMRLFEPRSDILQALSGSGICVSLGTKNEDLQTLGTSQDAANEWIDQNVAPYKETCFLAITLGNEAIPGQYASFIPQAMTNIHNALVTIDRDNVLVSTVLADSTLGVSYPPSAGKFTPEAEGVLSQVACVAANLNSPIMINVYPYFAYASDPQNVLLDYALFNSSEPVVADGPYQYSNLFDAMVDAFYVAFENLGHPDIALYVSETGWPSTGNEPYTSVANAQAYSNYLKNYKLKGKGTPRRPRKPLEIFIFALINEDLKPAGVEQNFGLFNRDLTPVYSFC